MLYAVMPKDDYKRACEVLRDITKETETIESGELEEKINKVYSVGEAAGKAAGYSTGYAEGHNQGIADGLAKTDDATCTEDKALEGETFYADGEKKTGNIKIAVGGISAAVNPSLGYNNGEECVALSYTPSEPIYISPSQGNVTLKAELSAFGDTLPEDVKKGKIFTSKSGFKEVGTRTEPTVSLDNGVLRIR